MKVILMTFKERQALRKYATFLLGEGHLDKYEYIMRLAKEGNPKNKNTLLQYGSLDIDVIKRRKKLKQLMGRGYTQIQLAKMVGCGIGNLRDDVKALRDLKKLHQV